MRILYYSKIFEISPVAFVAMGENKSDFLKTHLNCKTISNYYSAPSKTL